MGHGRPTSFEQHERSPGASGCESGRLLLRFSPSPPEQFEVEPDARSSKSSDNENQARAPTPEIQPVFVEENLASTSRFFLQRSRTGGIGDEGAQPRSLFHQRPQPTKGAVQKGVGPNPAPRQGTTKKGRGDKKNLLE